MGMAVPIYFTAEQVRGLPDDGNRYEVVRGELLVTPAPRLWHQEIVGRLYMATSRYLNKEPIGHAFQAPADISWSPDTLVQPDVFVVPLAEARTMDWARIATLLLVAEVLSPSSRRADRFSKRLEYQRHDVPVYWIVDPDERVVEIWTPGDSFPLFEQQRLAWHPAGAATPLQIDLGELFRPV